LRVLFASRDRLDSGNERGPDALERGTDRPHESGYREVKRRDVSVRLRVSFSNIRCRRLHGDRLAFERKIVIEAGKERVGFRIVVKPCAGQRDRDSCAVARERVICPKSSSGANDDAGVGLIPSVLNRKWIVLYTSTLSCSGC